MALAALLVQRACLPPTDSLVLPRVRPPNPSRGSLCVSDAFVCAPALAVPARAVDTARLRHGVRSLAPTFLFISSLASTTVEPGFRGAERGISGALWGIVARLAQSEDHNRIF